MTTQRIATSTLSSRTARRRTLARWLLPLAMGFGGLAGCSPPAASVFQIEALKIPKGTKTLTLYANVNESAVAIRDSKYLVMGDEESHKFPRLVVDFGAVDGGKLAIGIRAETESGCGKADSVWEANMIGLQTYYRLPMLLEPRTHKLTVTRAMSGGSSVALEENLVYLNGAKCEKDDCLEVPQLACAPAKVEARPFNGHTLDYWADSVDSNVKKCEGKEECEVTMDRDRKLTAFFKHIDTKPGQ